MRFKLSKTYPKAAPTVEVEKSSSLNKKELQELQQIIEQTIKANLNQVMCHEIVSAVQTFLEGQQQFVQESFYEAMVRKEQEKTRRIENLRQEVITSDIDNTIAMKGPQDGKPFKGKERPQKVSALAGGNLLESSKKIVEEMNKRQLEEMNLSILQSSRVFTAKKTSTVMPGGAGERARRGGSLFQDLDEDSVSSDETAGDHRRRKQPLPGLEAMVLDYSKSRYKQEFDELEVLGSGASGEVWKVRHKLDKKIYAVKKIDLSHRNNKTLRPKIQREVTTISSLFHKHIVRYYAAWEEQYEEEEEEEAASEDLSADIVSGTTGKSSSTAMTGRGAKPRSAWFEGNPLLKEAESELRDHRSLKRVSSNPRKEQSVFFASEESDERGGLRQSSGYEYNPLYDSRAFRFEGESASSSSSSSSEEDENDESSSSSESNKDNSNPSSSSSASAPSSESLPEETESERKKKESQSQKKDRKADWLFIQMEFCHTTLRKIIDEKELWKRENEIKRLLREMLEVLAYIHDRKVIHRELLILLWLSSTPRHLIGYCPLPKLLTGPRNWERSSRILFPMSTRINGDRSLWSSGGLQRI